MASPDLQWIEMTDFTPGIFSNNNLAGGVEVTATNPCMANPTNTYRCRAIPTGGLAPMPRMKEAFALTTPPTPAPSSPIANQYIINGLGTWGQVIGSTNPLTNEDHRIEVHLLLSWTSAGTPTVHNAAWIREHIYEDTPYTETIYSDSNAVAGDVEYQYAYFLKTRMSTLAAVLEPGELVMVCIYTPPSQDLFINRASPDPATPTASPSSTIEIMDGDTAIYRKAVAHQGRIVVGQFAIYGRGKESTASVNEDIVYSDVNQPTTSLTLPEVYVPEIDQNISDWASMTANQMIVVKDLGGGYVLQGALDDVTVVRLPNLMSPDGSPTVCGTQTPRGWVYSAGDRGLYIWNGGDQAEPISTQLDGSVFTANSVETAGHAGSCDRWLDLLLAPQFWTYDLEQKGWWRLDNPSDYPSAMTFFSTSKYRQQMISARQKFTGGGSGGNQNAFYLWEYDDLAYTWSWESHPIWISRDRLMGVRQGVIAAEGQGTITVTFTDQTGSVVFTKVITVASSTVRNYRFNVDAVAENFKVRFQASGNNGGGAGTYEAPILHRAFFGWSEAAHLPAV